MNSTTDWPNQLLKSGVIKERIQKTEASLIEVFKSFDSSKWEDLVWHGEYSYYYLASGLIDHDIYHLGQIFLHHKRDNND